MEFNREITIRDARPNDSQLYYNWANDPIVRRMAFHSEPIPLESHCKWFEEKLKSEKSHLTVCYSGNTPIGQVRFDEVREGEYEIDISVDSEFRSKGLGREMLKVALDYVHDKYQINSFLAEVKVENIPSQKMFMSVGFVVKKIENQIIYYKFQF